VGNADVVCGVPSLRRLIAFDLDGTLVDSRRDLAASMNRLLAAYGLPPQSEAAIGRMVGDGAPTLVARASRIRQTLGWQPRHDDLAKIVSTALAWERKLAAGQWGSTR